MEPLFFCFFFLFTLTSSQSINDINSLPNVAPNMQPSASSIKPNVADSSTTSYSSYPPGSENTPPSHLHQSAYPPGSENTPPSHLPPGSENTPPSHLHQSAYPPGSENTPPSHLHSDISFPPSDAPSPSLWPSSESQSETETSSFEIQSQFSEPSSISNTDSISTTDSISSSDQAAASSALSASLMSTSRNNEGGAGASNNQDTSIKKICDNTDYPDVCVATVTPFMKENNVDVEKVLDVAMKASDQFAKMGFAAAKRASQSRFAPPNTKKMLKTCLESWDTVLYNYEQAIEALRIHDSGRMSTMLSAAITDISDCEDAFEGVFNPLKDYGEKLVKMTSICLAIVSQLAS